MFNEYAPNHIYQKYITTVAMQDFDYIIHYAELLDGTTIEFLNSHPLYEIYYVIDGTLSVYIDGSKFTLMAGSILFIAPDVSHYIIYEPNNRRSYFALIFDFLSKVTSKSAATLEYSEIKEGLDLISKENYIIIEEVFDIEDILVQIWNETREKKIGWNSISNSLYYQYFIHALRKIYKTNSKQKKPEGILNLGLEASKFIHMNYQNKITIENVSEYLNITPRHVNRVFDALFGTTFSRTLKILRMEYAKNYLCNSNYSMEKIAELVGFSSVTTLSSIFYEVEGVTISQYRNKHEM